MKKRIIIILAALAILSGCAAKPATEATEATEAPGQMQIGNPWRDYDTLADAENACGLVFPVPEDVPSGYAAESYRVMNNSLLEVRYRNGESEITVRMQDGDDEDISGIYENFTAVEITDRNGSAVTRKEAADCIVYLVRNNGCSFSVCVTGAAPESMCDEILSHIC